MVLKILSPFNHELPFGFALHLPGPYVYRLDWKQVYAGGELSFEQGGGDRLSF